MEPVSSLLYSQGPATGPYPKRDWWIQSTPPPPLL